MTERSRSGASIIAPPPSEKQDLEVITPFSGERAALDRLDGAYKTVSEMSDEDRNFLNALLLRYKPQKIVEIGVSKGGSSIVILNAIQEIEGARLYSIDYAEKWYCDNTLNTGCFVDNYPELKGKWTLHTGGLALRFLDTIGAGIDFCLIDTVHFNPGETLDFLMILPYLTENAVVVFHDTKVHVSCYMKEIRFREEGITNNLLISAIYGTKLIDRVLSQDGDPFRAILIMMSEVFPNIGAIRINADTRKHLFEVFNLLTIKWSYLPSVEEEKELLAFFSLHYEKRFVEYTERVFEHHRRCFKIIEDERPPPPPPPGKVPLARRAARKLKRIVVSALRWT